MMAVGAEGRRKKHEDDIVQQAHELDKQRAQEHLPKLMDLLGRASSLQFDIRVEGGRFKVSVNSGDESWVHSVSSTHVDWRDFADLDCLRLEVEREEAQLAEEQRVKELRKTAYAKLTEEERDALFKTGW